MQIQKTDFRTLSRLRFAVIGDGTASICMKHGIYPDFIPDNFYASELGNGLTKIVKEGERVLILRARRGSHELTSSLESAGIIFDDVALYDTITPGETPLSNRIKKLLKDGVVDAVTFTSGSTVRGFMEIVNPDKKALSEFTAICIGEKTEKIAREMGMKTKICDSISEDGLLKKFFEI